MSGTNLVKREGERLPSVEQVEGNKARRSHEFPAHPETSAELVRIGQGHSQGCSVVRVNGFSREGNQKFASCGTEKQCYGDSASWAIWGETES